MKKHLSEETDLAIRRELEELARIHLPAELLECFRTEKVYLVRNVRIALINGLTPQTERYSFAERTLLKWRTNHEMRGKYELYVKTMEMQNLRPHPFKLFREGERFEKIKEMQRLQIHPGSSVRFMPTGNVGRVTRIDEDGNVTLEDESGQLMVTAVSPFRLKREP